MRGDDTCRGRAAKEWGAKPAHNSKPVKSQHSDWMRTEIPHSSCVNGSYPEVHPRFTSTSTIFDASSRLAGSSGTGIPLGIFGYPNDGRSRASWSNSSSGVDQTPGSLKVAGWIRSGEGVLAAQGNFGKQQQPNFPLAITLTNTGPWGM